MLLHTYATQRTIGIHALRTRGHARPRVHLADRRIANLCARRFLCYSTFVCSLHVGTPAHVCTVYGLPVNNHRARRSLYYTPVQFLTDGLRFNPSTANIGSHVIAPEPKDTKDFVHKFNRLTIYRQPTQLRPSPMHADAGGSIQSKIQHRPHTGTTAPHAGTSPSKKNPCRFHMSISVSRPRHADLECNYTAHPRHREHKAIQHGTYSSRSL